MSAAQKVIDMWNWKVEKLAVELRHKLDTYDLPGPYRLYIIDQLYSDKVLAILTDDIRANMQALGRLIFIQISYFDEEPYEFFIQPGTEREAIKNWDLMYNPKPNTKSEDDIMNNEQFQKFMDQQQQYWNLQSQQQQLTQAALSEIVQKLTTPVIVPSGFLEKIKEKWEALGIILAILIAGGGGVIFLENQISKDITPIKTEMQDINYAINGKLGQPGMLTQLEIINQKLGESKNNKK